MLSADDIAQIEQVIAEYGHVVDNNRWDRAHLVFAREFVYDFSAFDRPDIEGAVGLREALKSRKIYSHHTTNITVEETETETETETGAGRAVARSKFIGFPVEGPPITGDYLDDFIHTDEGWRLLRRRSSVREPSFPR